METNKILQQEIFNIIESQIRDKKPPETKQAYERLIKSGFGRTDAKKHIGQCVAVELFNVMKYHKPFDEKRYIQNLLKLPKEPFGD
jgi:plasmid replication initiation protein